MADRRGEIRRRAVKLLDEAFQRLTEERVLPRSPYEPWIRMGREFFGEHIHGLPSHGGFVASLEAAFPNRFTGELGARDFAELYPSALVTNAVARLTRARQPYEARQPAALEVVSAFMRYVGAATLPIAAVYAVAGVQASGSRLISGGLRVIRSASSPESRRIIEGLIPGAGFAIGDAPLFRTGLPTSLLVTSATFSLASSNTRHPPIDRAFSSASARLDDLVSAARLATNATIHVLGYAIGEPGPFQVYRASVGTFPFDWLADVRRAITLDPPLIKRLNRLHSLWRTSVVSEDKVVPTLSIAIARFNRSFGGEHWQQRLVDLAVALEAALGQEDATTEIQLRLQSRAAALLADVADDASRIFDDLGVIYNLRSRVVHGSSQSSEKLRKLFERIPATVPGRMPGIKTELLIDRCRDLVRRAILARLFLSQGQEPAWPLRGSKDLDKRLADDAERRRLRQLWRNGLKGIGLSEAASPAATPVVFGASPEPTG